MRRPLALAASLLLVGLLSGPAAAEPFPAPDGFVVDTAGVIPAAVETTLERELRDFSARTGNQVAVAVIGSLDGQAVEDYARDLFNTWGVGQRGSDNGVLLLLAVEDRRSRIQVGYGLEAQLPADRTQAILDELVAPSARAGNYGGAVQKAERAIRSELGDAAAQPALPGSAEDPFGGGRAGEAFADATTGGDVPALVDGPVAAVDDGPSPWLFFGPVLGIGAVTLALFAMAVGRSTGGRVRRFGAGAATGAAYGETWRHTSGTGLGSGWDSGSAGSSGSDFGGGSSGDGGSSGSW